MLALLGTELRVATGEQLREALAKARAGTTILVAPGEYAGGLRIEGLRGASGRPIVVAAADAGRPPLFRGGASGLHLSRIEHVELRDLVFVGATGNGLNLDDGGVRERPSRHVVLRNLVIRDVGPQGNCDGIKLSGLDDFLVEGCTIERWGSQGSGIDMVGCHHGRVEGNTLRHDGKGGSGVQMKGGSAEIAVRRNRFEDAGSRAINIGGSTGLGFFRPPLGPPPHAEARSILVEGNTLIGSDAPFALVGVDGAVVRANTVYLPRRWALRILQETTAQGFVACRGGEFTRNIVVFSSAHWREGGVNVGPSTDASSFTFSRNWWYCLDDPERSAPRLPTVERDAVSGRDPRFRAADAGDLRLRTDSPARGFGADEPAGAR